MSAICDREDSPNWITQVRTRLARRRAEKPATKAGQIRALWPDIEAALAAGQSLKTIHQWLKEDAGIVLGVTSLTSYISRIRRREAAKHSLEARAVQLVQSRTESIAALSGRREPLIPCFAPGPASNQTDDPLAQAMRVLSQPKLDIRKIHNDGDPEGRNLI